MQKLQRGFIRILNGPTGSLLASLALASFLGGVALAAPADDAGPATERSGGLGLATAAEAGTVFADPDRAERADVSSDVRAGVLPAPPAHAHAGGVVTGPDAERGSAAHRQDRWAGHERSDRGSRQGAGSPDHASGRGTPQGGGQPPSVTTPAVGTIGGGDTGSGTTGSTGGGNVDGGSGRQQAGGQPMDRGRGTPAAPS